MFNEFEIVMFSCTLDYYKWKYQDIVPIEAGNFLREFPLNMGIDMDNDCKKLIIYFLLIGYSIKVIVFFYFFLL